MNNNEIEEKEEKEEGEDRDKKMNPEDSGTGGSIHNPKSAIRNDDQHKNNSDSKPLKAKAKVKRKRKGPIKRTGKLIIVESPTKANTIKKFVGSGFTVKASFGHLIDLPKSRLGVDVEKNFEPTYIVMKGRHKALKELKESASRVKDIYLAPDPDREGEAISWHLRKALFTEGGAVIHRIQLHEITKPSVLEALAHPVEVNLDLVNAQQARRVLDRLVGYQVSPILWKKVRRGLSAGRVQSVALRILVERELEIQAFKPQEYWKITATLLSHPSPDMPFQARLVEMNGTKYEIGTVTEEGQAKNIVDECLKSSFIVTQTEEKERRRNPSAPFTTSTLQQEAARKLGFPVDRTMRVAQQLFEGIELGEEGPTGLITYMRTDSVRIAPQFQGEVRAYLSQKYGAAYVPSTPPVYKSRKSAQEAHEAIRPTQATRHPDEIASFLTKEQHKLYELIWRRCLSSQMTPAVFVVTAVDIEVEASKASTSTLSAVEGSKKIYRFRANGNRVQFDGFLVLWALDESDEEGEGLLPPLKKEEVLKLIELLPTQHFTAPPPRFTEAALVKALEENGIGRPSTYAPTIATIVNRGYVQRDQGRLTPSELGMIVCKLLIEHFGNIFDVPFTAKMEDELDEVEEGHKQWQSVLEEFYGPFKIALSKAEEEMKNIKQELAEVINEACEKCGKPMVIRFGRFGKFIACSGYPDCRNTKPIAPARTFAAKCPTDAGDIVERRSRRGRFFYGCKNYPTCTFAVWDPPADTPCPQCGGLVVEKRKKDQTLFKCNKPECGYSHIVMKEVSSPSVSI